MKATEKKLQSKLTEYVLSWINSDDRFNDALELMELIRSEVGDRESEGTIAMVEHWLRWLGWYYEFETFKIVTMYYNRWIKIDDWAEIDDDYWNRMAKIIIQLSK